MQAEAVATELPALLPWLAMGIRQRRLVMALLWTCAIAHAGCVLEERDLVTTDGGADAATDAGDSAMDASSACAEPCEGDTPICDESGLEPRCVECIAGIVDCADDLRPHCNAETGRCVECRSSNDCTTLPVCDDVTGMCVAS